MRVTVRHGINGDEELTTQVVVGVTVGWDLMEQMARKLALDSPFQIVFYLSCTAEMLSGANYQFADGAHRLRGMLSGAKATISNRRALPNANDSGI